MAGLIIDPTPNSVMQPTVVVDIQLRVMQWDRPKIPVAVKSSDPKLKPLTVTERPMEFAKLGLDWYDTAGPSNVNTDTAVPAMAPTVIAMTGIVTCAVWDRQLVEVCDVQAAVSQSFASM
jgi:hypothetical protein